jgi:hypothetical protein
VAMRPLLSEQDFLAARPPKRQGSRDADSPLPDYRTQKDCTSGLNDHSRNDKSYGYPMDGFRILGRFENNSCAYRKTRYDAHRQQNNVGPERVRRPREKIA